MEETTADIEDNSKNGTIQNGEYACQNCGNRVLEVFTRCEYSGDLFEDLAFASRAQEFFSRFTVVAKCSECSQLNTPIEYECA
jgi:hypothetical protein